MSGSRFVRALIVAGLLGTGGVAWSQAPNEAGCTLTKQVYTCDWQSFVARLNHAKTVAVETQSLDRFTARQLRELVAELGKKVTPEDTAADLTFLLIPMQSTGIHIGPAGEPL